MIDGSEWVHWANCSSKKFSPKGRTGQNVQINKSKFISVYINNYMHGYGWDHLMNM